MSERYAKVRNVPGNKLTGREAAEVELRISVALRLAEARTARGRTQKDLAACCGVDDTLLSHIEASRSAPSLFVAMLLADELDVTLDWLTGRTEEGGP